MAGRTLCTPASNSLPPSTPRRKYEFEGDNDRSPGEGHGRRELKRNTRGHSLERRPGERDGQKTGPPPRAPSWGITTHRRLVQAKGDVPKKEGFDVERKRSRIGFDDEN